MVKKIMALTLLFAAFSAVVMPAAWAKKGADDPCPKGVEFPPPCQ